MKMQNLKKSFLLFLAASLILPHISLAAEFNPNFILSDEELQNYSSMNRADIQAFLDNYGGYVASYTSSDASGTLRYAADHIYLASQEHRINPKYILVKLQKEQSLITDKDPTQKQLDWATGYGVCDSCRTDDPTIQKYRGFATQVNNSAGIMRWYYDNLARESWIKRANVSYQIDNTTVTPATLATAFLYTYTPHLHGNQNFWTLWQKWFEQVYPNGTLLKSSDNPTVYVIQGGKKRPLASLTALISRYDPKLVIVVPDSELARYETGKQISLPNYSILRQGSEYFLLDDDTLRPFESFEVVKKFGYNPEEFIDVSPTDISEYERGSTISSAVASPLGRVVRIRGTDALYYIKDNLYYNIPDKDIARVNFPTLPVEDITVEQMPPGERSGFIKFKDGTIVGNSQSGAIYVIEKGKRRHISSEEVFDGLGYSRENIIWLPETLELIHESGEPLYLRRTVMVNEGSPTQEDSETNKLAADPIYVGKKFESQIKSYVVTDASTGAILSGKNIDDQFAAASLAKAVTAYSLLTGGLNIQKNTAYNAKLHAVDNKFRIAIGEKIKNEHLLFAYLISSLNTPGRMLTNRATDVETKEIKALNKLAASLKLTKTTFADINGLLEGTKTTAREYSSLFRSILKQPDLKRILGMKEYKYKEIFDVDGKPNHSDYHSNALANRANLSYRIIASKTGSVPGVGTHLAMLIERKKDKKQFIVVTFGNEDQNDAFAEPDKISSWAINNL